MATIFLVFLATVQCGLTCTRTVSSRSTSLGTTIWRARATKKLAFKQGIMGQLILDGQSVGFTDFTASDGITLKMMYKDFTSAAEAVELFNKELARSERVVKREKKSNSAGTVVGERAEILLPSSLAGQANHAVLWTDGVKFHEIQSRSLTDILEFEKIYKY